MRLFDGNALVRHASDYGAKVVVVVVVGVAARYSIRYSYLLRAGRSVDRIPVWARFSSPGTGAHLAYCTMGTVSSQG